ncbi:MAG TPA: magnesium/cobalt transporter CorA [Anaerolineales bacterium]|jgi:magnesium transporter
MDLMHKNPGAAPGLEHDELAGLPGQDGQVAITCVDYSPSKCATVNVENLDEFLAHHRPDWSHVRWIDVTGLSNMRAIHALATKYNLHPLAIEDVLHLSQRPKVDAYGGDGSEMQARLFIVSYALMLKDGQLSSEQVSIFLGHNTLLTFREAPNNVWDPIFQRLKKKDSRLRNSDASFLMYTLLDANTDGCFPILEYYGDRAEELEVQILENARASRMSDIHQLKRDLLLMRRAFWPMREVVSNLQRDTHECISDETRVYLRDLYDHVIQIIDIIEIYRETTSDLTENYMSSVSNRLNEVMKVLTIISTIFIPMTFLAGVYGMNFHFFPELDQPWAYPAFWIVCAAIAGFMFVLFRRKNWF